MSVDVFNPDRAAAQEASRLTVARRTFRQSGIVDAVNEVKGLLPQGVETKVYYDEKGIKPHIVLIGPETDGVRTKLVWGSLWETDWYRRIPVDIPTRERMVLTVGVLGVNPKMLDFEARRSVTEPSSSNPQPFVGLTWSGVVGDVSEQREVRGRLHYALMQTFRFSPAQDLQLQRILPPPSPIRGLSYGNQPPGFAS